MAIVIVGLFINFRIKSVFNKIIEYQVEEKALSVSELFSEKLFGEFYELKHISAILQDENNLQLFYNLLKLNLEEGVTLGLLNVGDEDTLNPAVLNSFRGFDSINYSDDRDLIFSVPVYKDGNVCSVLYRKYSFPVVEEKFSINGYGNNGIICVVKSNGEVVIPFKNQDDHLIEMYNSEEIQNVFLSIRNKMLFSSAAAVHFQYKKSRYYLFEAEILNSDFRIQGVVTENSVSRGVNTLQALIIWIFGLLFAFMTVGIFVILSLHKKSEETDNEKNEAIAKSEAKGSFLANMSHEIRTPLNAIIGMNAVVLRESSDTKIKEYAGQIERSSETLLSIINDVLDFSKIESGKMEIRNAPYHFLSVINDTSMIVSEKIKQKNLSFKVDVDYKLPDELMGDEIRVKQILINLLNNAIKYTERGIVSLRIFGEREYDEVYLHLVIKDTGIGIKKTSIPFLFNSFSRADEERNKYIEGTGLGLAIVKQLVDMMDGTVNVRSAYGVGSEFEVVIPQKILGDKSMKDAGSLNVSKKKDELNFIAPDATVVIVDDNEVNLLVTEKLLSPTCIKTKSFSNPLYALEYLKEHKVDLMLFDDLMPEMSGVELLKNLKMYGSVNAETPSVALTANAMAGSREKYLAAGFDSYLSKPMSLQSLMRAIHNLLPNDFIKDNYESSSNDDAVSADTKNIDTSLGLSYCAGSTDIYKTIVHKYVEVADSKKQRMTDALDSNNWNDLLIEVHALKSSSLSIGAKKLSDDALEMELVLKDVNNGLNIEDNLSFVHNNINKLIALYDSVVREAEKI